MGELTIESTRAGVVIRRAGAVVAGPLRVGSLWPAGAEPCGVATESAPVVRVDASARRWLVAQFPPADRGGGLAACVAVSRSADADTGGWWLYEFTLPDPWRQADLVVDGAAWVIAADGGRATLDTAAMLAGQPARLTLSPR